MVAARQMVALAATLQLSVLATETHTALSSTFPSCHLVRVLGCYDDSTLGPYGLLPSPQPQLHDRVTLEACAAACGGHALTVAGIDAGNHCSCGDAKNLPQKLIRPAAECQGTPCHADVSETGCGGPSRTVAYTFTCPPQPPGPPTPPLPPPGFGRWLSDPTADGMPAFAYELDQTSRSGSVTASTYYRAAGQTLASWGRDPADNLFQFGTAHITFHVPISMGCVEPSRWENGAHFPC